MENHNVERTLHGRVSPVRSRTERSSLVHFMPPHVTLVRTGNGTVRIKIKIVGVLCTALVACAGVVLLSGCGPGAKPDDDALINGEYQEVSGDTANGGTRRMAKRLDDIARTWKNTTPKESEDKLFRPNRPELIRVYRERLATAANASELFQLDIKLGDELLWDGQTLEALKRYEHAYGLIANSTLPPNRRSFHHSKILKLMVLCYMRMGEQQNCLARHSADSCIFPISGSGVHTVTEPSRTAIAVLTEILSGNPQDMRSRWLLNLAYMTVGEYPVKVPQRWLISPHIFDSEHDIKRFSDIAGALAVDTLGLAGGCCIEDFDSDGDLDIVVSSWGLKDQLRFLRNNGDGTFSNRTREAGLIGQTGGLNICHADYDNDGHADILILRGGWLREYGRHPNSLLHNKGDATFDDVTENAALLSFYPTQTAAWGDFDNDSWLDLFIGNEQRAGEKYASQLFHNDGDGTFSDWAAASGLADIGYVKGVAWGDYDNDGLSDLYNSRMGQSNLRFRNMGKAIVAATDSKPEESNITGWKFSDVTDEAGVAEPVHSFPTWFFDYNNDGFLDLFVAGFDAAPIDAVAAAYLGQPNREGHPRLFRNQGNGTFADVTSEVRLDRVQLIMGANFGDLDGDGFLDMYLGTGAPNLGTLMPNRMFRNAGGKTFQDVTTSGGFGHLQKGHGIAFADIDGDGDQDVYAVMGGWYSGDVYRNVLFQNPGHGNHWLTLHLKGVQSNRTAIGARIRVTVNTPSGQLSFYATVGTGGSFGSASLAQEIGLGAATSIESLEIYWPTSGRRQTFRNLPIDPHARDPRRLRQHV